MDIVNSGWTDKAQEFFDMASDLDDQLFDIIEALEFVQNTLNKLVDLYPESLV